MFCTPRIKCEFTTDIYHVMIALLNFVLRKALPKGGAFSIAKYYYFLVIQMWLAT